MENENQEKISTETSSMDNAAPETSTEEEKNSFKENVRELRLSKEKYQRKAEQLEREFNQMKADLARSQANPNTSYDKISELSRDLNDIKAALSLHVNCPGYVNVVTEENEKKYAQKYPNHYAALSTHPDKKFVGASLYEGISEMLNGSSKDDLEERVKENKQSMRLSPENQVGSIMGGSSGMINKERMEQARLLEERIMSGRI